MKRILCIGPTPAAQRVMVFGNLVDNEVNRAVTTLDGAAGKALNVAKVLKTLGDDPLAMGFLGGPRGAELKSFLTKLEIEMDFVTVAVETRQCITVINQVAGTQTELVEESKAVASREYVELFQRVQRQLFGCQAMVLSGTLTPGGPKDFYSRCGSLAAGKDVLWLVDAKGAGLVTALPARPGVVKPNRLELASTLGRELNDESTLQAAMRELNEQGAQRVVVTAGKKPTLAYDGKFFWRVSVPQILALNPIGSGDSFTAALVWRLLRGDDLGEACRWASAAGSANALTLMPAELELVEVERLVLQVVAEKLPG